MISFPKMCNFYPISCKFVHNYWYYNKTNRGFRLRRHTKCNTTRLQVGSSVYDT